MEEEPDLEIDIERLVGQLELGVGKDDNTESDARLQPILQQVDDVIRNKHRKFTRKIKQVLSPCVQAKISYHIFL